MFVKSFASFALLTSLCAPYVSGAVVSLYIPENVGGPGVPITADPIGTDNSGHTTWRIGLGAPSGTFTNVDSAFGAVTATLVEGSTDAHAFANIGGATSVREDCVIATATASGGVPIASCVFQIADGSSTGTIAGTETATPMPVQAADKTGGSSGSPTKTTSGGSATGTPASGSSAPASTETGKGNGAGRTSFTGIGALGVLGLTNVLLSVL
ncbi:hypothetical protein LXA43DRAFT_1068112 [Ganoderma leucocontextum]|nr:hypothetical protein LXA43DRAFT_1068112 [Ganoderma leucocontextum]